MVLISGFGPCYDSIKADAGLTGCTVLILVAPDCDALCACRILTLLLKSDHVSYKVFPVSGYGDMYQAHAELVKNNMDLRSVIMLNCGALLNLATDFVLPPNATAYILDCHKPCHHANIHAPTSSRIVVVNDGTARLEDVPTDEDLEAADGEDGAEDEDADDDDDDEDDGIDYDDPDDAVLAASDAEDGDSKGGEEDRSPGSSGSRKRKRGGLALTRNNRQARRQRVETYYDEGSFYGIPIGYILYEAARDLNKDRNEMLWMAIVSVTSHYQQAHMGHEDYSTLIGRLQPDVTAKNTATARRTDPETGVILPAHAQGHIEFIEDYRFMLLEHWTLYDAMYYSNYIGTKLRVWHQDGKASLELLISRMGWNASDRHRHFAYVSQEKKRALRAEMEAKWNAAVADNEEDETDHLDLGDVFFGSYRCTTGYGAPVGAADVAYAVTALLESATTASSKTEEVPMAAVAAAAGGVDSQAPDGISDKDAWKLCFNTAYAALSLTNGDAFKEGVEAAKRLQQAIVTQGVALMFKDGGPTGIRNAGSFRYALMRTDEGGLFSQPMALASLARFVVEAQQARKKWLGDSAKPLIIGALSESKGTYLVVGINCSGRSGEVLKHEFGTQFQNAANKVRAHFRLDGFDTSVMEIRKDEVESFLEALAALRRLPPRAD